METYQFKTNINCSGCVKAVTPQLDQASGIQHWTVDTDNPEKILTVQAEGIDAAAVQQLVAKAGFKAETIQQA